jgi:membrane-bound hydrogenase subunit beta
MNIEELTEIFKEKGLETRVDSRTAGVKKKVERKSVWVHVNKNQLKEVVELLVETAEEFPHFCVASASDNGESVEVNYHFTINFGHPLKELQITFRCTLPKNNLSIPTLTDIIPATVFSERELREMMGIEIEGLEDKRHLFLTKDFPDGVYPWRRDETGPKSLNKLYEGWKE